MDGDESKWANADSESPPSIKRTSNADFPLEVMHVMCLTVISSLVGAGSGFCVRERKLLSNPSASWPPKNCFRTDFFSCSGHDFHYSKRRVIPFALCGGYRQIGICRDFVPASCSFQHSDDFWSLRRLFFHSFVVLGNIYPCSASLVAFHLPTAMV